MKEGEIIELYDPQFIKTVSERILEDDEFVDKDAFR